MRKLTHAFFLAMAISVSGIAQEVYQHISSKYIYAFLDELANDKIIELNAAVKPYSRMFIAQKLQQAYKCTEKLNTRQKKELEFFLKDFNKELMPGKKFKKRFDVFYYKDSLFAFSLNPILGVEYLNNQNGSNYHRWNGVEVFAYVGKHFGVYANLRDNHDKQALSGPLFLDTRPGAVYKEKLDYSEMRGGLTYAWNWGSLAFIKDHQEWGNYYHYPSILSGKAPSFTQIKLNIKPAKWFEFNYFHGWLVSTFVDSLRSYNFTNGYGSGTRTIFRKKYMASNLYTFKPFKNLFASVGNSVVYSDEFQPAFLIPFMFYKSVDHTLINSSDNSAGQNSQMFFDFSSRQIKHLHVYASIFFDDLSFTRFKENGHFDYYSLNTGFQVSNLVPNMFFTFEYFKSYPLVYKHIMPTTSYESNVYNLGHYMVDNSQNIYSSISFLPLKNLCIKAFYSLALHGPDHASLGTDRLEVVNQFLSSVEWKKESLGFSINYQVMNDIFIFCDLEHNRITGEMKKYNPEFYNGTTTTYTFGINYGF